ncbi:hypothetical protein COOONC_15624 [Cooperia oncophora]
MGPPVTRSRTHSADSRAVALSSGIDSEISASDNLANVLADLDDRATVHGRHAKTLRDAAVLAIAEFRPPHDSAPEANERVVQQNGSAFSHVHVSIVTDKKRTITSQRKTRKTHLKE